MESERLEQVVESERLAGFDDWPPRGAWVGDRDLPAHAEQAWRDAGGPGAAMAMCGRSSSVASPLSMHRSRTEDGAWLGGRPAYPPINQQDVQVVSP